MGGGGLELLVGGARVVGGRGRVVSMTTSRPLRDVLEGCYYVSRGYLVGGVSYSAGAVVGGGFLQCRGCGGRGLGS